MRTVGSKIHFIGVSYFYTLYFPQSVVELECKELEHKGPQLVG